MARSSGTEVSIQQEGGTLSPVTTHLSHEVGPVTISEFTVAANVEVPVHSHAEHHICVVLSGEFREAHKRSVVDCDARTMRYSPAGDSHDLRIGDEAMRCALIQTSSDVESGVARVYAKRAQLADRFVDLRSEYLLQADASPLIVDELAHELFAGLVSPEAHRAPSSASWLDDLRTVLDGPEATRFTLAELAARVGRHPMHVTRAFRLRYGCSVGAFAHRSRLRRARAQILASAAPLSMVALNCGFADQSHLTRSFSRAFGVSPGRYRRGERRR